MSFSGVRPTGSIAILALGAQAIRDDLVESLAEAVPATRAPVAALRPVAGLAELSRAIASAREDYLVFSLRPGLIWDSHLAGRVASEIAAMEADGVPWLCLCADGVDLAGIPHVSAFFNFEPTLNPDRGRRLVVQSGWTLCVVKTASLRAVTGRAVVPADLQAHLGALVLAGYARGLASVFCSRLFPCVSEHRALDYPRLDDALAALRPEALLAEADARDLFPDSVPRMALLTAWVGTLEAALQVRHRYSFVVRTIFRRPHLLRRCLISIEYLRSSLGIDVEVVLGTDSPADLVETEVAMLRHEFPRLVFVVARGDGFRGTSRVRNLLAGVQATSGARVCIIDDDDYFAPQAVKCLEQASAFGREDLVIFDTQIIGEKWLRASTKWHKEIVSYGTVFEAKNWATTLRATNSIPFCGVIHPGWFVRQVASEYAYDYDLSEDFVFHLLCFAHPRRPALRIIDGVCAYQSHRAGEDNVSNVADRTGWVSDTGNGLFQLLFEQGRTFDVVSGEVQAGEPPLRHRIAMLESDLRRAEQARLDATNLLATVIRRATATTR